MGQYASKVCGENRGNPTRDLHEVVQTRPTEIYRSIVEGMDEFSFTQETKEGQTGGADLHQLSEGSPQKINTKDFQFVRMLGRGSFGKVYFATSHESGKHYAIKVLQKKDLERTNSVVQVLREKEVLKRSDNPFIVKLYYSFQDRSSLYFCLELVTGGMLFSRLKHQKKFSLEETIFYASEVLLSLEYLHVQLKVMYRDLKPENILIGEDGHIKLTDFGVSHLGLNKTKTMCGTMEYLPPEVILNQEYNHVADYWSFGILIYEMLLGKTPFDQYKKSDSLLFKAICVGTISMPAKWSDVTKSFIRGLLTTDPAMRLGAKGIEEIKSHPFFKGVNFEEAAQQKSVPPFVPEPFDYSAPNQGSPLVCSELVEDTRQAEYDDFEFARKSFQLKAVSARTDSSGEQTVKGV